MASEKNLNLKKEIVNEITEKFKNSESVVLFSYQGLTVSDLSELRKNLKDADGEIKVYTYLEGPNAILFGEKLLEPIKVLSNFGKDHKNVNIISGVIDGKVVEPSVINEYASIPSMEGLLTMLAGGMIEHVKNLSIALNLYAEAKEEK